MGLPHPQQTIAANSKPGDQPDYQLERALDLAARHVRVQNQRVAEVEEPADASRAHNKAVQSQGYLVIGYALILSWRTWAWRHSLAGACKGHHRKPVTCIAVTVAIEVQQPADAASGSLR